MRLLRDVRLWFARARLASFRFFARNRTVLVATLGAAASVFLALWLQTPEKLFWLYILLLDQVLLILVGSTPAQYERIQLLESFLPSIYQVLCLGEKDRITVHHLRSGKREKYEQLTDYHPTKMGRGRSYGFAHGIVGQCFKVPSRPHSYSIPPGTDFAEAMRQRWHFSDDEITRLTQDRRSFFTIAIGRDGTLAKAVLYMDSPCAETFTETEEAKIADKLTQLFLPLLEEILRK